jgi:predicted MPP superfamily phosphohydrolase
MTVQIAHIGDMHFGGLANVPVVEALERMLPDLRPDAIVIGGDLSQRARHGEFQRGRAFANLCRETAPVLAIPGNHDVQWWRRPFIPFGKEAVYEKYRSYFGADLTPTLTIPGRAVIASALTAHGLAWGSLTARLRDMAVKRNAASSRRAPTSCCADTTTRRAPSCSTAGLRCRPPVHSRPGRVAAVPSPSISSRSILPRSK